MDVGKFSKVIKLLSGSVCVALLTACIDLNNDNSSPMTQALSKIKSAGYTYHAENGNRLVNGQGDLPNISPVDIILPANVTWIAAVADDNQQSVWAAVLATGEVKAYRLSGQTATEITISPNQLSSTVPPTVVIENDGDVKLANVFADGSAFTSPVIINKDTAELVYVANNGDVVLKNSTTEKRLAINALPYARILVDANKRILVLTDPTDRYDHTGVLGNFKHAAAISLIDTSTFTVTKKITIAAPDVIEGNALIWADVNSDGNNEIITTLAHNNGARIVVYNEDGSVYGESTAIEIDHRWRHQIAVAPFKSATETSLASVYIPHLGPKIEYFRLDDKSMTITTTSELSTYSSHLFTGINIDMTISGDFDNDGKLELLLINHASRTTNNPSIIGAFEYTDSGINFDWSLNLSDRITSNVAAVTLSDNTIAFGAGQGNKIRIWHP